jgi:hypothetical protein
MSTGPWEGGKGSRPRKYNVMKYLDNYDRIFGNAIRARLQQEDDQPEHQDRASSGKATGSSSGDSDEHGGTS